MTLKYLYTILLVFVFLSVSGQTDREIGYNEQALRKLFLADGVSSLNIDAELILHRNSLIEAYKSNLSKNKIPDIPDTACGNVGFQDGFNEWVYQRGERNSSTGVVNNFTTYNDPPNTSGSELLSSLYTDNDIPDNQITVDDLNLDQFGPNAIRLGRNNSGGWVERITKTITLTENNRLFSYNYAVVLEEPTNNHELHQQPFIRIFIEDTNNCSAFFAVLPATGTGSGIPGFILSHSTNNSNIYYRPTSTNSIDLLDPSHGFSGDVTITVEVGDCSLGGHYAYAFFEGSCGNLDNAIVANTGQNGFCINNNVSFSSQQESFGTPSWFVIDPSGNESGPYIVDTFDYYFNQLGEHTIRLEIEGAPNNPGNCEIAFNRTVNIIDCDCEECENCSSFSPIPGKKYVVSAWVLEEHAEQQITYTSSAIALQFQYENGAPLIQQINSFSPSGEIIDGWQRIIGEVIIPEAAQKISINLINTNTSINAYFDDIRIHPFNGNMKSFAYDQETQRLMAELDENNYATFYEYDAEGGLVRVKKETANGVYTIQETRSGNSTINN
ncbi:hypothetical protein [uncultured Lacinutrix sp.]|uniref:hypothetical protein n=1 Tax=uncultured Lacinutrix sp. TaxID=574032 RepID=UPI00262796F3|nr:hypothetical protein [uncultured Lacinutrix sp.]